MASTDILRAATIAGAETIGLQSDIGPLETDKLADFVILSCNPMENIRCSVFPR